MAGTPVRRWLRRGLVALLIMVAVGAAAVWLAGREATLKWLAARAIDHAGGALALEDVRGSLFGPLHAARIVWVDDSLRVEARNVLINWAPRALIHRRVHVSELAATHVDLRTKPADGPPPQLPDSLALPVAVTVTAVRIGELVVRTPQGVGTLREIAAAVNLGPAEHALRIERLVAAPGVIVAQATIGARAPFPVTGEASLAATAAQPPYRLSAGLSGELSRLDITARGSMGEARGNLRATLAPFAPQPLVAAHLEASDLDPAVLRSGLPGASLAATVDVRGRNDGGYGGAVALTNARAGPVDGERLPLAALSFAFAGTPAAMSLEDIVVDLGRAGRFNGKGTVRGARLELALDTGRLDLAGIAGRLRTTRLAGSVRLGVEQATQTIAADLEQGGFEIRLAAALEDGVLRIGRASARAGSGSLSLAGRLALAAPRQFAARGELSRVDLAAFGDFPASSLNGTFRAEGRLAPQPAGTIELDVSESRLRGYPFAAQARGKLAGERVEDARVELTLAGNRLALAGSYGGVGDRIEFTLAAPHLERIARGYGGRISGSGFVEGALAAPAAAFRIEGARLRLPDGSSLSALAGEGRLEHGIDGRITLRLDARNLRAGKIVVRDARLRADGTKNEHTLTLAAQGPRIDASLAAHGGWHEGGDWVGMVDSFAQRGRLDIRLEQPARLEIGPATFALENAHFVVGSARLRLASLRRSAESTAIRGSLAGLSAATLQPLVELPAAVRSTLVVSGQWDLARRADAAWSGHIGVARESGDLVLTAGAGMPLGLTRLNLDARLDAGRISTTAAAAGSLIGSLEATARLPISGDEVPALRRDAPVEAALTASMPSLAWLSAFGGASTTVAGKLEAAITAAGTWNDPRLTGTINGRGLEYLNVAQGVHLTGGRLAAELAGPALQVNEFSFKAGEGTFTASGRLGLGQSGPAAAIDWKAAQLEVLRRPDRLLVVSGAGHIALRARELAVTGRLTADRGLIELAERSGLTVSEDVVVKGRDREKAAPQDAPILPRIDLTADLGNQFYLKGLGIDARLSGSVRVTSRDERGLSARGRISVAEGAYSAYGQRLVIERGILSFIGPIDNPGLDILALRQNQEVAAGVAVTGTAASPSVRLVSRPDVPDTAKLSWLVLGRAPDTTGGREAALLRAAAGALLSQGESATLQGKIEQATGLDEFGFRSGDSVAASVVTLGKRLSANTYLVYEQGLGAAASIVKLRHKLTPRLTVQTQAGTETAVDLFYNLFFD